MSARQRSSSRSSRMTATRVSRGMPPCSRRRGPRAPIRTARIARTRRAGDRNTSAGRRCRSWALTDLLVCGRAMRCRSCRKVSVDHRRFSRFARGLRVVGRPGAFRRTTDGTSEARSSGDASSEVRTRCRNSGSPNRTASPNAAGDGNARRQKAECSAHPSPGCVVRAARRGLLFVGDGLHRLPAVSDAAAGAQGGGDHDRFGDRGFGCSGLDRAWRGPRCSTRTGWSPRPRPRSSPGWPGRGFPGSCRTRLCRTRRRPRPRPARPP
ncbi:hypothetical protein LY41_004558 [Prauserella halophila]|nr:hypothetical protein [Prauserella halophila]